MENQPTAQLDQWTFRRVVIATLVMVCVGLGFWLLYRFYQVIFILFVAIILGTVIRPVVLWFYRRGIPKLAGVLIVYILLFVFVVGFFLLLFPLVFDQGSAIIKEIPVYYQQLRTLAIGSPNQLIVNFNEFLPEVIPGFEFVTQTDIEMIASAGQAMGMISSVIKIVFILLVTLLLIFHWTLNGSRTIQSFLFLIPKNQRENISDLVGAVETKIGFFIAGQGVLCLVVGGLALIGYLSIGLPNAFVLALIAGAFEAIPMVGPTLGAIPAGVIALSVSPKTLIWVVVVTVIIQLLENNLLVPRIMSRAVGVNPFVSLLSIFAFSSLFGLAGALMAIPIAAIIQLLMDRFVFHQTDYEKEEPGSRGFASRLRYETNELAEGLQKQARLAKDGSALNEKQIDTVMDEIEAITKDLDMLLSQIPQAGSND